VLQAAPQLESAKPAFAALQPVKTPAEGERELHFRFDEDSWVEVRDRNDKVIFSKLNRAGAEERVSGTPPFKLIVGNARGVRLNYGEQAVDLAPHTRVAVARLTLQ
jgi:cytoskeleton protein RodZ